MLLFWRSLSTLIIFICLASSPFAMASEDIAYIVASDTVFAEVTGLRNYLERGGITVVQVKDDQLNKFDKAKHFLVIGSPDDKDFVGKLIRDSLNQDQIKDASRMGHSEPIVAPVGSREALFFATKYSLKTFIQGTASTWKAIFEEWYDIELNLSHIIGY